MKIFKKVLILTVAILSLSSSVAFGDCATKKVSQTAVDSGKVVPGETSGTSLPATQSGTAGNNGG